MLSATLFTIVFLWLFALSIGQVQINRWIRAMQDERSRVINFIEQTKDTWNENSQQHEEKKQ